MSDTAEEQRRLILDQFTRQAVPFSEMLAHSNEESVKLLIDMAQVEAETVMRRLAREEGIFCGVSSGGAVAAMLRLSREVENAVMVAIICDRGDRYLSTGVYDEPAAEH